MEKLKSMIWLPLSMSIFVAYAIQRGLIAFSKTDMVVPWFGQALSIYLFTVAIAMLFGGILMDNINSRKAMLLATILGSIGLLTVSYSPWGFGILFGLAAVLIKLIPFSGPMKLYNKDEAWKVAPQASAKNFGAAFFMWFLGAALIAFSWTGVSVILSGIFLISGIAVYYIMPDDKIEGWNVSIFPMLFKDWKFWAVMLYFFLMVGFFYRILAGFIPAIVANGFTKGFAVSLMAGSFLLAGFLRWPFAWLGQQIGHWKVALTGLGVMFLSIWITTFNPILALYVFAVGGSTHTPNYWAGCKKLWGPEHIATVLGLGYTAMYLGGGIIMGKW